MSIRVLAITGGHRVDLASFGELLLWVEEDTGGTVTHVQQPNAQLLLHGATEFDVVVLHDIAGLNLKRGEPPTPVDPTVAQREALASLVAGGVGLVVMHHALASWPTWDGWADAVGGRFNYAPGHRRGHAVPSSGTKYDVYRAFPRVEVGEVFRPILADVEACELDDELYVCDFDIGEVEPLVWCDANFDGATFLSTFEHVLVGAEKAPSCSGLGVGPNMLAWATSTAASPIVVIQPGDNGSTFSNASYRRLLANSVTWVASPEARRWAVERNRPFNMDL